MSQTPSSRPEFAKPELRLACQSVTAMRASISLTKPLSFSIERGSYLQLRGANGIGKSTFLRQWAGLIPFERGTITLNDAAYNPAQDRLSLKTIYLGHRDGFHGDLTGLETIQLFCDHLPEDALSNPLYKRQVASYSAGQRQKLNLLTLSDKADLWLLDEPSANLDDENLQQLEAKIISFIAKGGMIIAATHSDIAQDHVTHHITLEKAASQRFGEDS